MTDVNIDYLNPEYYQNRELSWLLFNTRVLGEARSRSTPLFERLKFLAITANNLDEFFMVRVASLKDMEHSHYKKPDISGMTPHEQLLAISKEAHKLVAREYDTYNQKLLPALVEEQLLIVDDLSDFTEEQLAFLDDYFDAEVYPVLTPMALDQSRPFPLIRNKTLNIGALIRKRGSADAADFATVQVPSVLPRFVELPHEKGEVRTLVLLEKIIARNMEKLFQSYEVICAHPYRIMRNAELGIDEDEASDLLIEIEKSLKRRQWGEVIRLEVEETMEPELLAILLREYSITDADLYRIDGPLDLTFLMEVYDLKGFKRFKMPPHEPARIPEVGPDADIFACIRAHDIFLHHPYQSFEPVVRFVRQAADDPNVLAIKQTLYRVGGNSPIIAALERAATNGKQVTVLVELKARFDEENNIVWARELEKAGCHVIYGLVGLKTHSKITLVVRHEDDGIRRYVHLGTGNYNDKTARLYTDCGILTCDPRIGEDATAIFNMISGYSEPKKWNSLIVAPFWLKDTFLSLIGREEQHAREGKKARIICKMNSVCDRDIIAALYRASAAGVQIDLIVRGICSIRTDIPGVSENIRVTSIVGNFLEHARIFYFSNDGADEVYMGSPDWMPRNMERRVEVVFPIYDPLIKAEAMHILDVQLADNVKAKVLNKKGTYKKKSRGDAPRINAQEVLAKEAHDRAEPPTEEPERTRRFVPVTDSREASGFVDKPLTDV